MKYLILLVLPLFLLGCEERYRYPCQDPENWDTKECKKPFCSANGTCPEDLQHYEKGKAAIPGQPGMPVPEPRKGDCK